MPKKTKAPATVAVAEHVLVLRTCDAKMRSYGGFVWPREGPISAPDWNPNPICGYGLHGLLWGEGIGGLLSWEPDAKWLVVSVPKDTLVKLDGKVKFPSGTVVFCGDRKDATEYLAANGGQGRKITGGTATAGDSGTATAGSGGTATAGYGGWIAILYWVENGKRWKTKIAPVKDEDGEGQLEPNKKYRLDGSGNFVLAD